MADAITTTATLKAECLEMDSETDRLLDAADFSGDSAAKLHKAAWAQCLTDLGRKHPPWLEVDIDDTDVLLPACHLCCYYILYRMSDIKDDSKKKRSYWTQYRAEMRDVSINNGVSAGSEVLFVRG